MRHIVYLFLLLNISFVLTGADAATTQEKLTQYLSALVSINTVTADQESNKQALKWVQDQLRPLPLYFRYHEFNGYHALVITTQDTKTPSVWLVSHMDVVPGPEFLFTPWIDNGIMYGRGAYDMKMAIACYILLMQELENQLGEYSIGIMLTTDEEIGGMNGVRMLLNEGYRSDVALLPDGGFDWKFEQAAKGVLQAKVVGHGRSAHASRPWNGENAINNLITALMGMIQYFDQEQKKYEEYYPTMNIGTIQGGSAANQVPDLAEAKIDIRFPPVLTADEIFGQLQGVVNKYPHVSVEKLITGSPSKANLSLPYFQRFKEIAKELYGIQIGSMLAHGSSDARFFGEKAIPVLVIAPRGGDIHSDDEWIDLSDLERFYAVMKKWVIEFSSRKEVPSP